MLSSNLKSLLGCLLCAAIVAVAQPVFAGPPTTVRGIDLPTVLAMWDRARLADRQLNPEDARQKASPNKLSEVQTIVLDPGHGGTNLGALGVAGVQEKYLTLELAYALRERLQEAYPGIRVVLTRYWDREMDLSERIHMANKLEADLFLSLHYNAAVHPRAVGFETYFLDQREATPGQAQVKGEPIATAADVVTGIEDEPLAEPDRTYNEEMAIIQRDLKRARQHRESGLLAETVQRQLARHLDSVNRGVKQANFGVLRGALMPAVVVESAFLSHPEEGSKAVEKDHRQKVVQALMDAVVDFDKKLAQARR